MDAQGEQFGTERLAKLIQGNTDLTVQELANAILLAASNFAEGKIFTDDITIITCKVGQ